MAVPDNGNGDLDPQAVAELRRLARSRPRSGREAVAKASALRALERLNRGKRQVPPMPEGWYPHEPGDPFYGGTLENARVLEDFLAVAAANLSDGGYSFYRFWRP